MAYIDHERLSACEINDRRVVRVVLHRGVPCVGGLGPVRGVEHVDVRCGAHDFYACGRVVSGNRHFTNALQRNARTR